MCGERMPFFPDLREYFIEFLKSNSVLYTSKDKAELNILIVTVLKTIQTLILFGYYTNHKDIDIVDSFTYSSSSIPHLSSISSGDKAPGSSV